MSNCIYIIKNFANNKIYIGKTEREGDVDEIAKKRFQEHIQESFNENTKAYTYCISRAIRKWGVQAFDYAILARDIPSEVLNVVIICHLEGMIIVILKHMRNPNPKIITPMHHV